MKFFKSLLYLFGNVYLAIALIAITACMVVAGTLIESKTGSHLFAAKWTYEHPFFFLLLVLFFINILFAALRRWPFKKKHTPFLITHLGLLMVIGGTMIKNRWGLQGQLSVWEGSGNQHVLIPHTYSLLIEEKKENTHQKSMIDLDPSRQEIHYPYHFPHLKCKLTGYAPHIEKKFETWIKGKNGYIAGFPPIPVNFWNRLLPFPESSSYPFPLASYFPNWSILVIHTSDIKEAVQHAYLQNLTIVITNKENPHDIQSFPLLEALKTDLSFAQGKLKLTLELPSDNLKENTPAFTLTWKPNQDSEEVRFALLLQGQGSLSIINQSNTWSKPLFTIDLMRPNPSLCLIEKEKEGGVYFLAFDVHGRYHIEHFPSDHVQTLIAYDQGFQGYGVQAVVPISNFPTGREDKENAEAYELTQQFKIALDKNPVISPPLQIFKLACEKAQVDFPTSFVRFLKEWNECPKFLLHSTSLSEETKKILFNINWDMIPELHKQALLWSDRLFNQLNVLWEQGQSPLKVLEQHHWPLLDQLRSVDHPPGDSFLNTLAQQITSLTLYLPGIEFSSAPTLEESARFLSAYFRNYGIDYQAISPPINKEKESFDRLENYWKEQSNNHHLSQSMIFETLLSLSMTPQELPIKLEEQRPGIVIEFQEKDSKQTIAFAYDETGSDLKWPILEGKYLVRFQPRLKELPYRIRLRQAREIPYPDSQQIYSYESDVIISEKNKIPIAQTLSMNRVYETWDGYRFYLGGIGHSFDSSLKRIQLAVNYDPVKYLMTYPGAGLVFLGIILLFWRKSGKKL